MQVLALTTVFTCLAAFFVAIRLWTRVRLVQKPGLDDLLTVLALLCAILYYAFVLVERRYGLGVPEFQLPQRVVLEQMRYLWLSIPFYNLSLILTKLSALVLFTRIFHCRTFLMATYITMASLIIFGLWIVISGFAFCIPISDFWTLNRTAHTEHCLPEGPVWFSNAAIQILTGIIILILPMPLLSKLHLHCNQKAGIVLIFCVGIFATAISSVRLYELSAMVRDRDFTDRNAEEAVWSSLENNVSIICACLPTLHPLISRIFSFFFRPQPLHSSPGSRNRSNTTQLTSQLTSPHRLSSRKPSVVDHTIGADGGVFYNDFFYAGPGSYSASIAKMGPEQAKEDEPGDGGIRVVKELTMESDCVDSVFPVGSHVGDVELGERNFDASESKSRKTSFERDLGEFEFPDYKGRMNCPI